LRFLAINPGWSFAGVIGAILFLSGLYLGLAGLVKGVFFTGVLGIGFMLIGWQLGGRFIMTERKNRNEHY
jgi:hypothetical protein